MKSSRDPAGPSACYDLVSDTPIHRSAQNDASWTFCAESNHPPALCLRGEYYPVPIDTHDPGSHSYLLQGSSQLTSLNSSSGPNPINKIA